MSLRFIGNAAVRLLFFNILWALWAPAQAGTVNAALPTTAPIGKSLSWLQESRPLDVPGALEHWRTGHFSPSSRPLLNFGIGARPVWLALEVDNETSTPLLRRLSIRTYWLDSIDIYYLHHDRVAKEFHTGDRLPFRERPILDRYFDFDYHFPPGRTLVLIRVETEDPMVLPVFFTTQEQDHQSDLLEGYSYGISSRKGDKQLTVSASIGVACVDGHIIDLEGLIAAADEGLYLAKEAGRNRVCSPCEAQPEAVS